MRLLANEPNEVRAHVVGSRRYTIVLTADGDHLDVFCDCPYFAGGDICKHIWATLLEAEADADGGTDPLAQPRARRSDRSRPPRERRDWAAAVRAVGESQRSHATVPSFAGARWPSDRELFYIVDVRRTLTHGSLSLDVVSRDRKRDGTWGKPKSPRFDQDVIAQLPDPTDREILSVLAGTQSRWSGSYGYYSAYGRGFPGSDVAVPPAVADVLIPLICHSGRGRLQTDPQDDQPRELRLDPGGAWELVLEGRADAGGGAHTINAVLRRGDVHMGLEELALTLSSGFLFWPDGTVAELDHGGAFGWIALIRRQGPVRVPAEDTDAFLESLLALPSLPRVDFPRELAFETVAIAPTPHLRLATSTSERLVGELSFDYGGLVIAHADRRRGVFVSGERRYVPRDVAVETEATATMRDVGFRRGVRGEHELPTRRLAKVVRDLTALGWHVEAEGKLYRSPGAWRFEVSSGIDWFDLSGGVDYEGSTVALPELLAAVRRGEHFVTLGDGSVGILPDDWLATYAQFAAAATVDGDRLRFKRSQAGLLDALLAAQPEVTLDDAFRRARDELRSFEGIEPVSEPDGFVGELRPYQRDGLGWLHFLERFGFGGCLADDMGLGKTVQVLALLERRRQQRAKGRGKRRIPPSLVVVPKSLVFNWLQEAARFAPKLAILDHTGARLEPGEHFESYDVVLTTYGTLRRDAALLQSVAFDYCILDEAQAIKNAATATAKAARLLNGDHRLALSGTPIENHLGELWSLFEFLNPGVLGSAGAFRSALTGSNGSSRAVLSHALRPFILRRTKEQVAKDLPVKSEQTLFCELSAGQRKQYDELRTHFHRELLERVDRDGMNRSKMFVLEALLRLRQAACHPGLIDKSKVLEPSAKLDVLVPQLVEVVQEGHKALVFSQFTQLLAIVRERLDREGIAYEYLDGRTRDRQRRVERFQSEPDLRLFLISLKAGGLGLNLTAAEYVFLLDPWWNPAVEAQAIDRAHRIGQTRPVFAYRIIASDTVEEKVLALQESKRSLADAIITADNSLIRQIRREDLELLLS